MLSSQKQHSTEARRGHETHKVEEARVERCGRGLILRVVVRLQVWVCEGLLDSNPMKQNSALRR